MKILITAHKIQNFTGSEINAFQLSQALLAQGHQVDVAAFVSGDPLRAMFDRRVGWLDLLAPRTEPLAYDLVWAHHTPVLAHLLFKQPLLDTRILFSSLGPFAPMESPPTFFNDLHLFLVNSQGNQRVLTGYGISPERVYYFPNYAPAAYFTDCKQAWPARPRRVAVVSNHAVEELRQFQALAAGQHLHVTRIGRKDENVYVDQRLLLPFDAVISIGKTVQYCLALKIPVFCYDHFGGPGYVTRANFERTKEFNFSGRETPVKRTAAGLLAEIEAGYPAALQEVQPLHALAQEQFCLETNLEELLSVTAQIPLTNIAALRQNNRLAERHNEYYIAELERRLRLERLFAQRADALTMLKRRVLRFARKLRR